MNYLGYYTQDQLQAVKGLYELAKRHLGTGGGNAAAQVLLGLYNGGRFPMDLTELRRFDEGNLALAMNVIHTDAFRCVLEVHALIASIYGWQPRQVGAEFEHWAHDLRLKGRCKKSFCRS